MGLFTQQPEHNEEWAGLPSEPLRPLSDAERLADAPLVDAAGLGLTGLGIGGAGAIEVAVIEVAAEPIEDRTAGD
ncbi:hypothetical protein [Microbacterium pumilum]|uniref:Uncharacterized protein n=1 Tax=Microbacterium pumilum TaxID=344165 RepID=A0ABN2STE3_9MICO